MDKATVKEISSRLDTHSAKQAEASAALVFEVLPYKNAPGYYVRVTAPNGRSLNVEEMKTNIPAFDTEAEAQTWIDNNGDNWARRALGLENSGDKSLS